LRSKNRQLRKQKHAERLKELEEKHLEEEKKNESEERAKVNSQRVQKWLQDKRKEVRLLSKREDVNLKIGKAPAVDASTGQFETLDSSHIVKASTAAKLKEDIDRREQLGQKLKAGKGTSNYSCKRPLLHGVRSVPIVSKRKPLAATADNIVQSNKSGCPGTGSGRSVNAEIHESAMGTTHDTKFKNNEACDAKTEQLKRPKSSKHRKKKENKPVSESAKNEQKIHLSYDQWLKDKCKRDKKKDGQERKLQESDHLLDSIVTDLAGRRIRIIESNKKCVDSGVHRIDDKANLCRRGGETQNGEWENFSLHGEVDNPTDEEKYQWRSVEEVSRPMSGRSSHGSRSSPGSARQHSSPVSKTRARARLTMLKSTQSPRSRVENISDKEPTPIVNASLKRSGDAASHYAKHVWTTFSDEVWKQVNEEEEGVGPFQLVMDSEGTEQVVPCGDDASGTPNEDVSSGAQNAEISSGVPDAKTSPDSVAPNGENSSVAPNGDIDDRLHQRRSASDDVNDSSPPPSFSLANVNFSGIFYTVDLDCVQHRIHEASVDVEAKTKSSDDGKDMDATSAEVKDAEVAPVHGKSRDPHKKKVNFGGIVYEVDKQESFSDTSIEEDLDIVEGEDHDDKNDGFFITRIDDEA
jgi:hypothetical protein